MESGRALNHLEWIQPPFDLISTTTPTAIPFFSIRLAYHFRLDLLLHSSFKNLHERVFVLWVSVSFCHLISLVEQKLSRLCHVPRLKDLWCQRAFQFKGTNFFHFTNDSFSSPCLRGFSFVNGREFSKNSGNEGTSQLETSRRNSFNGRQWTNVLLAVNVLIYIAQIATKGKLLFWGAKINSLIDKGQFWRLVTSSFLHANVAHLLVNCYSLNSIGPTMESVSGPRRYLAVYFSSAIASSAMSYWFSKPPAVGASGAIFGLVGSLAVFVTRHRRITGGGRGDLQQIAQVIFLNMVIGLLYKGIDNWGHVGGLLGGAAMSWLLGPAWKYESMSNDGLRIFSDRAPIFNLINKQRKPRQLN